MKIKRFFAANVRQAIRSVREQLGPDAVILSNRRVSDGIEIVAAIDYDANLLKMVGSVSNNVSPRAASPMNEPEKTQAPAGRAAAFFSTFKAGADPSAAKQTASTSKTNPTAAASVPATKPEWAQDPVLTQVQHEIKSLRSLVEHQLCGLVWSDATRRHPQRAALLRRLMEFGLSPKVCHELADRALLESDLDSAWERALLLLTERIPVTDDDILAHGGVIVLVGPTGVGKTTTVAKLAARFTLRHGPRRVALVTTDSYRIGAHEQLRTYGRILDIPVRVASDRQELESALQGLDDKALVVVDTAGMGQRDLRLSEQLAMIQGSLPSVRAYLVLSATTQLSGLEEIIAAFSSLQLAGCIVTKVDETTRLGALISVAIQKQLPLAYFSDGQRVPEDLHPARAQNLVSRGVVLMHKVNMEFGDEGLALAFGGMVAHASA